MATINLGNIKFNWKGTYNAGTAYAVDDVVSYNGSSYVCILASTGNLPTNTTYWNVMSQAGTDGTDLTSTLTTQGDILYRDGSGLQRLGAGTSGQFLKTQGTGANPVWADTGGQLVLIKKITPSGSVNTIEFINGSNDVVLDASTYERYFFSFSGIGCQTDVNNLGVQIGTSSAYITGTNQYKWGGHDMYETSSQSGRGNSSTYWSLGNVGTSNASGETNTSGEMWLNLNAEGGQDYPNFFSRLVYWQDNNQSVFSHVGGNLASTSTINRIKFFWHSNYGGGTVGTLRSFENYGSITMYGLKTT
tara:strand:+ start:306 stop:1217 length:912 start_codon:yes stop_codon:yes gene_type:complete